MSTPTKTTPPAKPAAAPRKPGVRSANPSSLNITLRGKSGNTMVITANRGKAGCTSYVLLKGADKSRTRGATTGHATWEDAVKACDSLKAKAMADGWTLSRGGGGFHAKPDAFTADALPKP